MPQIDHSEFLQRMMTLLGAQAGSIPTGTGGLKPPMADLNVAPLQFAEVYGPDGLLRQTAGRATATGNAELSALLVALSEALQDDQLDLEPSPARKRRLIGYVYPVV